MDTGTKSGAPQLVKPTAPSSLQIYKDVNRAAGIGFRIIFGWLGIDINKYAHFTPGVKRVKKNTGKKKKGGWLSFIPG